MGQSTQRGWLQRSAIGGGLGVMLLATASVVATPSLQDKASSDSVSQTISLDTSSPVAMVTNYTETDSTSAAHRTNSNGLSSLAMSHHAVQHRSAAKQMMTEQFSSPPPGPSSLHLLALGLILVPVVRKLGLIPR